MNLAALEQKNLVNAWRQAQTRQSKNQKRSGSAGKKSKQRKYDFDLDKFFKTIAAVIARTVLIAACFLVVFASHRFITSSIHFNINKVDWLGHQRLSAEELILWIGPIVGGNIFQLDLNKVSQKLAEHPWIQTASVRRVFPQGLHIELKERTPFARVQLDQVYVMDNYGILIGTEEKEFNELPLITGILAKNPTLGINVANEKIIRGLKMMYNINLLPIFKKNPIDTVHIKNRWRVTFITHDKNIKVHMQLGMAQESFKNLMLVLGSIGEDAKNLSDIDLSFKNKIVVKHTKNIHKSFEKPKKT